MLDYGQISEKYNIAIKQSNSAYQYHMITTQWTKSYNYESEQTSSYCA